MDKWRDYNVKIDVEVHPSVQCSNCGSHNVKIEMHYITVRSNGDWELRGARCEQCGCLHDITIATPDITESIAHVETENGKLDKLKNKYWNAKMKVRGTPQYDELEELEVAIGNLLRERRGYS